MDTVAILTSHAQALDDVGTAGQEGTGFAMCKSRSLRVVITLAGLDRRTHPPSMEIPVSLYTATLDGWDSRTGRCQ